MVKGNQSATASSALICIWLPSCCARDSLGSVRAYFRTLLFRQLLQLDTMDLRDQQMLVSVLFRKINQERVAHEKGRESELEFPVFSLLEESHRFAPADGDARSLPVLSTILSEGRKFGVGIGTISQRPSKIDDDVLSQCKTQIIMQIQNPLDQDAVKKGVEDVGEDLLSELPGLTPGQAIIAGDSVNTPFLTRIRERYVKLRLHRI